MNNGINSDMFGYKLPAAVYPALPGSGLPPPGKVIYDGDIVEGQVVEDKDGRS